MGTDNNIREELLKQMNGGSGEKAKTDKTSIEKILARDAARVKRMKWIAACSWLLVMILFIAGGILSTPFARRLSTPPSPYQNMIWPSVLAIILRGLIVIAAILTGSFYIRWISLKTRQIQQRLCEIEKVLRKLDKD